MIAEESLGKFAWFDRDSGGTLHPAGKLQPNRWGLYDMLGGVAEWCSDTGDPSSGGADPNGAFGIIKGGAFDTPAIACRSAARKHAFRTLTGSDVGFRVVLVP
jgi:formylglycine-generating enzyme required for sulfatase activity